MPVALTDFLLFVCLALFFTADTAVAPPPSRKSSPGAWMRGQRRLVPARLEKVLQRVGNLLNTAGAGIGVDRLVMLCTGAEEIGDVLWSPVERA